MFPTHGEVPHSQQQERDGYGSDGEPALREWETGEMGQLSGATGAQAYFRIVLLQNEEHELEGEGDEEEAV